MIRITWKGPYISENIYYNILDKKEIFKAIREMREKTLITNQRSQFFK